MPLEVWTARISSRDPDRFDITRKSGGPAGEVFAPSWAILRPAMDARTEGEQLIRFASQPDLAPILLEGYRIRAAELDAEAWAIYVPAYTAEMRQSYRAHRVAWDGLLARSRVVLVCYCTDPARCHRTLLAGFLGKLGADVRGEMSKSTLDPAGGMSASTSEYAARRKARTA